MILCNENAISSGGYQISNSLRFQSASSTYLTRTPASAGNRQRWTWSAWVKRGTLGSRQALFGDTTGTSDNTSGFIAFTSADQFEYTGYFTQFRTSTQVFRDPSAWYHIVVALDTTNATAQNRVRIYINNVEITSWSINNAFTLNADMSINQNTVHQIGAASGGFSFDGYLSEVNFIDGQALTPSSFGSTDPTSGQWVAKKYTGTYGTNGFYLPFSNGTSTTTLGADSSGNSNNWTLTNFTRSAGVSDCWMEDVPSGNGSAGTQPNSNYCVLNPLKVVGGNTATSRANLSASSSANSWGTRFSTIGMLTGKWYWEVVRTGNTYGASAGMATDQLTAGDLTGTGAIGWAENGQFCNEAAGYSGSSKTWVTNDILQFRYDADVGQLDINVNNGTWFTLVTGKSGRTWFPIVKCYGGSDALSINFGNRSFAYTPPTGFKALCTANLPVATIKRGNQYMDATLYTGNGSGQSVVNAGGFKPDLVWIKDRSAATSHVLTDSVRGTSAQLFSNLTNAEQTNATYVTALNSNGFTVGVGNSGTGVVNNTTPDLFVGWQWQAGQGSTSSNTNGSITSTTSVNATAGFSVVTFTGTATTATIGHGLGVAPKMIIVKSRSNTGSWNIYHESIGNTKGIYLNLTQAATTSTNFWNNTSPTSSVFTLSGANECNGSGYTSVAYCFAEISGYSKFGSYTGNGSTDGSFIFTGFQPRYILIKSAGTANGWGVFDTARKTFNVNGTILAPNFSDAEATYTQWQIDILSNGFKVRSGAYNETNGNGVTYIFAAFATNPFAQSNAF